MTLTAYLGDEIYTLKFKEHCKARKKRDEAEWHINNGFLMTYVHFSRVFSPYKSVSGLVQSPYNI